MNGKIIRGRGLAILIAATTAVVVLVVVGLLVIRQADSDRLQPQDQATHSSPGPDTAAGVTETATNPPSVESPIMPLGDSVPTKESAEEFFRYFLRLYAYSYNVLDAEDLAAISSSDCKFCSSVVNNVAEAKSLKRSVQAPALEIVDLVAAPGDAGNGLIVNALVSQGSVVTLGPDGQEIGRSAPIVNARLDAKVVWKTGRWQVQAVQIVSKGLPK